MKLFLKIFLILLLPVCSSAQVSPLFLEPTKKQADSLRIVLKEASKDTIRMVALRELSLFYLDINADSALYYIEQELPIVKKLNLKIWEADALDLHGLILSNQGNYPKSLQSFIEAIKIAEDKETEKNIWQISKFTYGKDPNIARLTMLAILYLDYSGLYRRTQNIEKGVTAIRKSIKIAALIKDYSILSLASNRLGELYYDMGNPDTAIFYFQDALKYSNKSGYAKYKSDALNSLGTIYSDKHNYTLTKQYYAESLISAEEQNNTTAIGKANIYLSQLYMTTGNLDSSYYFAKKGEAILLATGRLPFVLSAYNQLVKVYKLQHKTDSALAYLESANAVNDSLNNSKKVRQFQNISFDEQIKLQELEKEKIQTQNKIRTYSLLAGLAFFLLIAFLLYRNNQKEKKAKRLLQGKNKEIEKTLLELKSTQSQLIQSEKMASLGELTAGIAHEIQNPLNFVNNFSEVNTELADELKTELAAGNMQLANEIASDIKDNSEKINHHGKRAADIVKGMLQHSQRSSGVKEPTDINTLCDEYLRLAYHGLRAKDKSFNAIMKTDFDKSIGNINIIPQDIGRVILNLITNAFYAMNEREKLLANSQQLIASTYKPTVSVSTKKEGNTVLISVADNGGGIPQKILDKIFQPFFTTKPTGQGTGLGLSLSLSYDIVTKGHGGQVTVETEQGIGTTFIIQLPTK